VRWRYLLRPVIDLPALRLYPIVLIGIMVNNLVPARVGELVRAYLVGREGAVSRSSALGTIAIDRIFDGLTLVVILGITAAIAGTNPAIAGLGAGTAVLFSAATGVLVFLVYSPRRTRVWLDRLLAKMPARLGSQAGPRIELFLDGLVVLRSPLLLIKAAVLSVVSWLMEATLYWVVGEAFGIDAAFTTYVLIVAGATLALSFFATPGGIGPFEVTTREILVHFGTAGTVASAYALALHILLLLPIITAGFVCLWLSQLSLGDLLSRREVQPQEPDPATVP
jgi:uncharacterized protein (TIRG00374 family)